MEILYRPQVPYCFIMQYIAHVLFCLSLETRLLCHFPLLPRTCIVSFFPLLGKIHAVPRSNPIRSSHQVVIFESREFRRRSDWGTTPGSERGVRWDLRVGWI